MEKVTKEQIQAWKAKHGEVFMLQVDDKQCYLHKPDRKTLSAAMSLSKADPIKFNEVLLNNCWLAGDEEIKTDDAYFMGASSQLDKLMEYKQAELKKI